MHVQCMRRFTQLSILDATIATYRLGVTGGVSSVGYRTTGVSNLTDVSTSICLYCGDVRRVKNGKFYFRQQSASVRRDSVRQLLRSLISRITSPLYVVALYPARILQGFLFRAGHPLCTVFLWHTHLQTA